MEEGTPGLEEEDKIMKKSGKNNDTIITRIMPSIDDNLAVPAGGAMN